MITKDTTFTFKICTAWFWGAPPGNALETGKGTDWGSAPSVLIQTSCKQTYTLSKQCKIRSWRDLGCTTSDNHAPALDDLSICDHGSKTTKKLITLEPEQLEPWNKLWHKQNKQDQNCATLTFFHLIILRSTAWKCPGNRWKHRLRQCTFSSDPNLLQTNIHTVQTM